MSLLPNILRSLMNVLGFTVSGYLDLLLLNTWIYCFWLLGFTASDYLDLLLLVTWIYCFRLLLLYLQTFLSNPESFFFYQIYTSEKDQNLFVHTLDACCA